MAGRRQPAWPRACPLLPDTREATPRPRLGLEMGRYPLPGQVLWSRPRAR
jgi:hypothetical protein